MIRTCPNNGLADCPFHGPVARNQGFTSACDAKSRDQRNYRTANDGQKSKQERLGCSFP